jgi:hypothetical protein
MKWTSSFARLDTVPSPPKHAPGEAPKVEKQAGIVCGKDDQLLKVIEAKLQIV